MAKLLEWIGCTVVGAACTFSGCVEDTTAGKDGLGTTSGGNGGTLVQGGVNGEGAISAEGGDRQGEGGADGDGCLRCGGAGGEHAGASGSFAGGGDFSSGGAMSNPGCIDPRQEDEGFGSAPESHGGAPGDDGIIVIIEHGAGEAVGERVSFSSWGSWDTRCYPFESSWSFVEIPAGSELTDDDIETSGDDGAARDATFFPDAAGTYRLQFTLTTADGRSESRDIEFIVLPLRIPYVLVASEGGTFIGEARAVDDDGADDSAIGAEFLQEPSSEEAWIATEFEDDVASRTAALYPSPHVSQWALVYPADLRQGARTLRVLPGYEDGGVLLEGEAPNLSLGLVRVESESVSVNSEPPVTVFRLVTSRADGYSPHVLREIRALPAQPIPPFRYGNDRVAWLEGGVEEGVELELWAVKNSTETDPVQLMSCGSREGDFTAIRQVLAPARRTLVALVSTADSGENQAIYRLTADDDGRYSCAVDSPLNERVYAAPSAAQPVLEFAVYAPSTALFIVQQLADGRSTEVWLAGYTQATTPSRIVDLAGRNTGVRSRLSSLVWTRTTYESGPGVTRPLSSEIWRARPDGSHPTRLVAHESTSERAVLITLGLNAGIKIPREPVTSGAAGAAN
jgi:hypothetical protein